MGIDLEQFHQAFFEESFELLGMMEKALLEFDPQKPDKENINLMFRVMHSIKGSSAAFDFKVVTDFAHTIENYLSQVRDGKKILNQPELDLLLNAVDVLRDMIDQLQNNQANDPASIQDIKKNFSPLAAEEIKSETNPEVLSKQKFQAEPKDQPQPSIEQESKTKPVGKQIGWSMIFKPNTDIFKNGNDPIFILRMLKNIGEVSCQADLVDIPQLDKINPYNCYLGWNINLVTDSPIDEVEKIFNWVIDDCLFDIQPLIKIPTSKSKTALKKQQIKTESQIAVTKQAVPTPEAAPVKPTPIHPQEKPEEQLHTAKIFEQTSIRVATNKIDALINNVGELVITQSMLTQLASILEIDQMQKFQEALQQLAKNCHELQSNIMKIRMLPIGFVFDRFHRIVRDMSHKLAKQIELKISGEQTELDKNMMEKIADPLTHLVRNAIDHGIESPEERIRKNKSPTGLIELSAYQQEGNIVICVQDDGQGMDKKVILSRAKELGLIDDSKKLSNKEIYDIVFLPGFSTSTIVTDVSGRGVGLDAVRKNIFELGGNIEIKSTPEVGTKLTLFLPLTLAIMDCQLVKVDGQVLAIPLISITEIINSTPENFHTTSNGAKMYHLRENYIPIINLQDILQISAVNKSKKTKKSLIVVVEINRRLYGLVINSLLSQQQVVIKSLNENYKNLPGISGATILGDGSLALIVDVNEVIDIAAKKVVLYPEHKDTHKITMEDLDVHAHEEDDQILSNEMQVLIFSLGIERYGINILNISEIRHNEIITPLPNAPDYLLGIINVRGAIVPVIDVNQRLNLTPSEIKNAIIIVKIKINKTARLFGMVVDEVCETFQFNKTDIIPLPETANIIMRNHFMGLITVDNKMVSLLRVNNMLPLR